MWWAVWLLLVVVALLVYLVGFNLKPAKRFGLIEFRRLARSARCVVQGLVVSGILDVDHQQFAERAVVLAQLGTVEGLGYECVFANEANAECDKRANDRVQSETNIQAYKKTICELKERINAEKALIQGTIIIDDAIKADLALIS